MERRSVVRESAAALRPGAARRLSATWVALLVVGLLLAVVTPHPAEQELLAALTTDRPPGLVDAARVATTLGDLWITAVLASVVLAVVWRTTPAPRLVAVAGLSFVGSTLVIGVLKLLTDRARPDGGLVETFSSAFPSGHAGRAAAVYGLLVWAAYRYVGPVLLRITLVAGALVLAGAIALSRIYLGVHWPSDVFVGVVLGSLWATTVIRHVRPPPTDQEPARW